MNAGVGCPLQRMAQDLQQSWADFAAAPPALVQSIQKSSATLSPVQNRVQPRDYVSPEQRIAEFALQCSYQRSGQADADLAQKYKEEASRPKIDENSLKTALAHRRHEISRAFRAISAYDKPESPNSPLKTSQLFELFCVLGYCRPESKEDRCEIEEKVLFLIDKNAASKGTIEQFDVEQFILALDNLQFENAPEPFLSIVNHEGLAQWFQSARKMQHLNSQRHAKPFKANADEVFERMKRLGLQTDLEKCTFAPTVQINEALAQSGTQRLLQKVKESGQKVNENAPLHQNAVQIQKYHEFLRKQAETRIMTEMECTFKPEISQHAKEKKMNKTVVERMGEYGTILNQKKKQWENERKEKEDKEAQAVLESSKKPTINKLDKSIFQKPIAASQHAQKFTERIAKARNEKLDFQQRLATLGQPRQIDKNAPLNTAAVERSEMLSRLKTATKKIPIVVLEIQTAPGKVGKIAIHSGDTPGALVDGFCKIYSLSEDKRETLLTAVVKAFEDNHVTLPSRPTTSPPQRNPSSKPLKSSDLQLSHLKNVKTSTPVKYSQESHLQYEVPEPSLGVSTSDEEPRKIPLTVKPKSPMWKFDVENLE